MNSAFPKVIDEIKRQDNTNALHKAVPDHNCKNSECEAECGKVVKIAKNLGVDPVPMVQTAIEKTLASKFGCKRKTEAFSNIGAQIPGCKFGYNYGSHPDATDAQLAAGKTGGNSHSITGTQTPDVSKGTQVADNNRVHKSGDSGSDGSANVKPAYPENVLKRVRSKTVEYAKKQIGKQYGTLKCNKFVMEVFNRPNGRVVSGPDSSYGVVERLPSAKEFYNGEVKGFVRVDKPEPGDICADMGTGRIEGHGHVGIVSGDNTTISASSVTSTIVENDWGFRKDENKNARFYRYIGDERLPPL